MKIKKYDKLPYPDEIKLSANPFIVFIRRDVALHIEPGDRQTDIAMKLRIFMKLKEKQAMTLAGYYMSLGERISGRRADEPWNRSGELRGAARRYRPVSRTSSGTRSK